MIWTELPAGRVTSRTRGGGGVDDDTSAGGGEAEAEREPEQTTVAAPEVQGCPVMSTLIGQVKKLVAPAGHCTCVRTAQNLHTC